MRKAKRRWRPKLQGQGARPPTAAGPQRAKSLGPTLAEVHLARHAGPGVAVNALELCHGSSGGGAIALKAAGAHVVGGCELVGSRWVEYCKLHPANNTQCMDVAEYISKLKTGCALCLLTGPCQCFMNLSQEEPLGGADPRECNLPVVQELAKLPRHCWPSTIVVENICSFRTHGGGQLFNEFADILFGMGYEMVLLEMHAERFGLPIRRRRLYVAALPTIGALQRFMAHLPVATCNTDEVGFASVSCKEPSLWDNHELAVPWKAVHRASKRNSLGWFTFASCHYNGVLQCLITRGGSTHCLGYGTYVVLTPNEERFRHSKLSFQEVLHGEYPVRLLTCAELCKLQGSPLDTSWVHGEGKKAHTAWGEAVAVPCCTAVCQAALHAAGYDTPEEATQVGACGKGGGFDRHTGKVVQVEVGVAHQRRVWLVTP